MGALYGEARLLFRGLMAYQRGGDENNCCSLRSTLVSFLGSGVEESLCYSQQAYIIAECFSIFVVKYKPKGSNGNTETNFTPKL